MVLRRLESFRRHRKESAVVDGLKIGPPKRASDGVAYYPITCLNPRCGYHWEQSAEPFPKKCPKCKMNWSLLAKRIKTLRAERGLSQAALAEKTGLSLEYIAKLEQGQRVSPSLPALVRIALALKVKLRVELDP